MAITHPKHRVKRLHVIPLEDGEECYERKSNLKRVKGPVKESDLTALEEQGLQALLSLHSDIRPLQRRDVKSRLDADAPVKVRSLDLRSSCIAAAVKLSKNLDALQHQATEKRTTIRFLGDPLAVPSPPMGRPLALPPALPRVPYGYVFPAAKSQCSPNKVQSS